MKANKRWKQNTQILKSANKRSGGKKEKEKGWLADQWPDILLQFWQLPCVPQPHSPWWLTQRSVRFLGARWRSSSTDPLSTHHRHHHLPFHQWTSWWQTPQSRSPRSSLPRHSSFGVTAQCSHELPCHGTACSWRTTCHQALFKKERKREREREKMKSTNQNRPKNPHQPIKNLSLSSSELSKVKRNSKKKEKRRGKERKGKDLSPRFFEKTLTS